MNLKPKQLPLLTLGSGILGAGLFLLFFSFGTDNRGLFPATHPALLMLYLLTGAVLVMLFLGLRKITDTPAYAALFPTSQSTLVGCIVGSAGIVLSMALADIKATTPMAVLTYLCGSAAALSLLFVGYFRKKLLQPHYYFHSIVSVYLILQLVTQYQSWSTQPQLIAYLPQLMALVFLMLSAYHRATLDAGIGKRRDFTFFNLGALFFCCIAAISNQWPFFLGMAVWCFTNQCSLEQQSGPAPMHLPEEVLYCMDMLEEAGYSAFAVGGCVRDHLLGLTPSDYDLCTSATPEQMCDLFSRHQLVRNGEKHGTIGVVVAGQVYEITTFRTEGSYSDTRHPDWVEFVTDINQDLARRDFTVNAMAYSPKAGFVDPFGGQEDLRNKVLRAVGDPETRFREDALRILRGVRFAVRFDLVPEEQTLEAMRSCVSLMAQLARERISSELCKLLPLISTEQLLCYRDVIIQVIPELCQGDDTQQDLYPRVAAIVGAASQDLPVRMAALLHTLGEETPNDILQGLKTSNALRNRTLQLIRLHATVLPPDKKQLRHIAGEHGEDVIRQVIDLQKAIAIADGQDTADLDMAGLLLNTLQQDGSCLTVKDLAITGSDLLKLGVEPGPLIGKCMQSLLSLVQDEILANTKQELLDAAKSFFDL